MCAASNVRELFPTPATTELRNARTTPRSSSQNGGTTQVVTGSFVSLSVCVPVQSYALMREGLSSLETASDYVFLFVCLSCFVIAAFLFLLIVYHHDCRQQFTVTAGSTVSIVNARSITCCSAAFLSILT